MSNLCYSCSRFWEASVLKSVTYSVQTAITRLMLFTIHAGTARGHAVCKHSLHAYLHISKSNVIASLTGMASVVATKLQKIVTSNQLQQFYPPERLHALTNRVIQNVDFFALAQRWRMPTELAVDLAALALYDIVIYADDSGSM